MDDDWYGERDEESMREPDEIETRELDMALRGLALLHDDHHLGMQALNIAIVDSFIMGLETTARGYRDADEGINVEHAAFLNAQSQMWLFAAYELLRTWRQRCNEVLKWHRTGGLKQKIEALERDDGYFHINRRLYADALKKVRDDPSCVQRIQDDLARTHICFRQMEFLRVALAKHEVSGSPKMMAYAPGYARIDMWTGSMSYQMSNGDIILGEVTRRSFAEGMRYFAETDVPSKEDMDACDRFYSLKPSDVPDWGPTNSAS